MNCPARFSLEKGKRKLASPERDVYISPSAAQASELPDRYLTVFRLLHRATARMAKLVDAWDLKEVLYDMEALIIQGLAVEAKENVADM